MVQGFKLKRDNYDIGLHNNNYMNIYKGKGLRRRGYIYYEIIVWTDFYQYIGKE